MWGAEELPGYVVRRLRGRRRAGTQEMSLNNYTELPVTDSDRMGHGQPLGRNKKLSFLCD